MVSCRRWFDQTYPQYALLRWHSAMGARMYARECQKLKQMGAITGQPDWTLMVQSYDGKWHTLNLEFKRPGNDPAQYPQQVAVGRALIQAGQQYKVVFSLAQFQDAVREHLEPPLVESPRPPLQVGATLGGDLSVDCEDAYC